MKLSKLFLMAAMVAALAVVGCSSDDNGDGGTGGNGTGGNGTGGNGGDGDFRLSIDSSRGVDAIIDRYNIVGHRKRDMIHPTPNAHLPVMQLMLNHLCPAKQH